MNDVAFLKVAQRSFDQEIDDDLALFVDVVFELIVVFVQNWFLDQVLVVAAAGVDHARRIQPADLECLLEIFALRIIPAVDLLHHTVRIFEDLIDHHIAQIHEGYELVLFDQNSVGLIDQQLLADLHFALA